MFVFNKNIFFICAFIFLFLPSGVLSQDQLDTPPLIEAELNIVKNGENTGFELSFNNPNKGPICLYRDSFNFIGLDDHFSPKIVNSAFWLWDENENEIRSRGMQYTADFYEFIEIKPLGEFKQIFWIDDKFQFPEGNQTYKAQFSTSYSIETPCSEPRGRISSPIISFEYEKPFSFFGWLDQFIQEKSFFELQIGLLFITGLMIWELSFFTKKSVIVVILVPLFNTNIVLLMCSYGFHYAEYYSITAALITFETSLIYSSVIILGCYIFKKIKLKSKKGV